MTADLITRDQALDVIGGAAGAILGLLALRNVAGDSVVAKALLCGDHLLANRTSSESGHPAWKTIPGHVREGKLLTGYSHGAAGIAYSLLRLHQVTQKSALLDAAVSGMAYERSVFSPRANNWPDYRRSASTRDDQEPSFMSSWCHGATGIGLARLGSLGILDTAEIRQEIQVALDTTQKLDLLQGVDKVCCGNWGRIEFLLKASDRLARPDLLSAANQRATWVMTRVAHTGNYYLAPYLPDGVHVLGFFQGTAGIGYELLRLARPNQFPSVLLWE
jgi:lantibiotic modifying enzyme